MTILYTSTLAFALSATVTWAKSQVCSPDACLEGKSSSSLLAHESSSSRHLTFGTYLESSSPNFEVSEILNISLTSDSLQIDPPLRPIGFPNVNYFGEDETWTDGNWKLEDWQSLYLPTGWYGVLEGGKVIWRGVSDKGELPNDATGLQLVKAASASCDPSCSSHGTCLPSLDGNGGKCTCATGWAGEACDQCATGYWGPSCTAGPPNCTVWDDSLSGTGVCIGTVTSSSSSCKCEHGTCTSSTECICSAGWITNSTASSSLCSVCAEGFFQDSQGNCLACPLGCDSCSLQADTTDTPVCLSCRDNLSLSSASPATCIASAGSCSAGQYYDTKSSVCQSCSPACTTCIGPTPSDCLSCASPRVDLQGQCIYYDASTGICDSSLSKLEGVFVVNNEKQKCDACPSGCLKCSIPSFSNIEGYDQLRCSSCQEGWLLQDGKCTKTCDDGWFVPEGSAQGNGTCEKCDSSCTTCQRSSTTCTSCPSPLSAASGSCVSNCPSSTTPLNGTCVPCPTDCTSCSSPTTCSACPADRPVLNQGRCLDHCPSDEWFDPSRASCQACDWTCGSCSASGSKGCTSCPDGYLLRRGECISATSLCGEGGHVNGLGVCLSWMIDRPSSRWKWLAFLSILIAIGALFAGFRWHVLRERKKTRKATKEFGDRLDDRDVHERLRILRLEKVLGLERIRTGAPTPLSSHASRNGGGNGHRGGADRFDEGKKNRFRDLLLPSRRRQGGAATDVEMSLRGSKTDQSNFAPDRERQRESAFAYGIPPPPYVPSASSDSDTTSPWPLADRKASSFREHIDEVNQSSGGFARRDSLDSIPTPVLPSFTNWSPTPHARFHSRTMSTADGSDKGRFSSETKTKTKTIVHSMASSPSPTSKFPTASVAGGGGGGGLMPPPRPGMMGTPSRLGSYQEKQRPLHRSIRSQSSIFGYPSNTLDGAHDAEHGGSDGLGEVDVDFERRLGELWPYMKAAAEESQEQQQEHHKSAEAEGRRQEEGWI